MTEVLTPGDAEAAREAVEWAAAEEVPFEIVGAGTKRGLGRPVQAAHVLDVSGLAGVTLYEPAELVMSARTGTPLAEIEALLAEHDQQLAFEPPDLGPLMGGDAAAGTIGGALACNLSGPRRVKAGAARDHFLGVKAVTGRGEAVKAGGRVVKNVTGYDVCKLLAGAYGTLAVMTELTFKVVPAPETCRTVLVFGLDDAAAGRAMSAALASPNEPSAAAHLPEAIAARSEARHVANVRAAVTAVRIEGPAPSVEHRARALRDVLGDVGQMAALRDPESALLWREVGDVAPFAGADGRSVWRLSVPPTAGPGLVARIAAETDAEAYYDWGGGLVWLALAGGGDGGAATVRAAVAEASGHATLVRADAAVRGAIEVFQAQPAPLAALTRRVKESFDPRRILNPGRMYAGV